MMNLEAGEDYKISDLIGLEQNCDRYNYESPLAAPTPFERHDGIDDGGESSATKNV